MLSYTAVQGGKKSGGAGIKFEAEATGWLQAHSVPLTVRTRGGEWVETRHNQTAKGSLVWG